MAEKEYIEREEAEGLLSQPITMSMCLTREECLAKRRQRDIDVALLRSIPAADVLSRDEAIKMGAELAAMHGSDANSQQLEEAYLKGVEYGMTRRDVQPVLKARWKPVMCAGNPNMQDKDEWCGALFVCDKCNWTMIGESNFCPNCGAKMDGDEGNER